jgi:glucosamine--fructose-6-phosphate aminotransferase (isomerizing)
LQAFAGQLGVENILVSADIKKKRDNIRKNVEAWLKQPALGMIPLFMVR